MLASDPHQCSTSHRGEIFSSGLVAHFGSYVLKPIRTWVILSTALNINRHMTHSIESAKLGPYLSVQKQFRGVSVCRQSSQFLGPVNTPSINVQNVGRKSYLRTLLWSYGGGVCYHLQRYVFCVIHCRRNGCLILVSIFKNMLQVFVIYQTCMCGILRKQYLMSSCNISSNLVILRALNIVQPPSAVIPIT